MNLETLRTEIQDFLESEGLAIFYGHSRALDSLPIVYWDCHRYPNYKDFVKAAKAAGVKLMVFHQRELSADQIDEGIEQLETLDVPREEHRALERRLNELRSYEGFTCALELSFDHGGRIYMFDLRTEWYEELSEILGDLHMLGGESDSDEDDETMGGYFSKN
jgi:hypothetical protein